LAFSVLNVLIGIIGFLKKLPLLPNTLGFGSLEDLMAITALDTSCIVGSVILLRSSSCSIIP